MTEKKKTRFVLKLKQEPQSQADVNNDNQVYSASEDQSMHGDVDDADIFAEHSVHMCNVSDATVRPKL